MAAFNFQGNVLEWVLDVRAAFFRSFVTPWGFVILTCHFQKSINHICFPFLLCQLFWIEVNCLHCQTFFQKLFAHPSLSPFYTMPLFLVFFFFHTQQLVSTHANTSRFIAAQQSTSPSLSLPLSHVLFLCLSSSPSLTHSHTDGEPGPFSLKTTVTTNWCSFIASSVYVCLTFMLGR